MPAAAGDRAAAAGAGGGLALRVRRVEGAPAVAVRVVLPGGARQEPVPGLGLVTGRMLAEGSRRRDWRQLSDELESRGMALSTAGTYEVHGLALDALAADWEPALEWAAELVLEPAFPEERCRWICRQTLAELDSLGDQPEVRTAWGFIDQLQAPHPRGRPLQGDRASLEAVTAVDCARFHARRLARGAMVVVAGRIDEEAVARRCEELFAGVGAETGGDAEPPAPQPDRTPRKVALPAGDQAHLYLGHLTVPRADPDFAALELVAVVLGAGSGLSGRIPGRIREREGLAYGASVHTVAGAGLDPGRLVAYVGTAPETVEQARRGVVEELERLLADGIEEDELESARAYLLGREPFRRETARQWAELLAEAELYRLAEDDPEVRRARLEAPDRAAVEAAARRHLRPSEIVVTVGEPSPRPGGG